MSFKQSLFWDTDPTTIDPKKNKSYVIERILDYGDEKDVSWMWKTYQPTDILGVIRSSRSLHKSTKSLWTILLQKYN